MRLHPSLLIAGLLAFGAHAAAAEGAGSRNARSRQNTAAAGNRRSANPQPSNPIDPAVLKWTTTTYKLEGIRNDRERAFKQRQIAEVLSVIKADTGAWYGQHFQSYLEGQPPAGMAAKILAAIAEGRNASEIRAAAAKVLVDALAAKDTGTGQFILPMPNSRGLLNGQTIPGRNGAPAAPPPPARPSQPPAGPPPPAAGDPPSGPPPSGGGPVVAAPTGPSPVPELGNPVEATDPQGRPIQDQAEQEFARMLAGDPALREMAAVRLARFIWDDHQGINFVAEAVRKDEAVATQLKAGTVAAVLKWVTAQPGKAGLLVRYLGVPESERPQGLKPEVAAHLTGSGPDAEQKLANALVRWSAASETLEKILVEGQPFDVKISPLTAQQPVPWIFSFLKEAYDKAWTLRYGEGLDQSIGNVNQNDQGTDPVPGETPVGRRPGRTGKPGPGFDKEELYGKVGELGVFKVNTEDCPGCNPRYLSVRVITEPRSKEDPTLIDKLAIYDITNPNQPIYGKVVPLNFAGKVKLKDGGREYAIGQDESGRFSLKVSDGGSVVRTDGGGEKMPTIADFYRARAQFAQDKNQIVNIGGREFFVWGQGTKDGGANVYLPKDAVIGTVSHGGDPTQVRPSAMAYLNEMVDGQERLIVTDGKAKLLGPDGKSDFKVGGKDFHLVWNGTAFVVREGAGPAARPITTSGGNTGGGNPTGGNPTGGNPTAQTDSEGFPTLRDKDDEKKEAPYVRNPAQPLDLYKHIDVTKLNQQLKDNGATNVAIYQINIGGARPPTAEERSKAIAPLGPESMKGIPINQFYAIVFKDGTSSALPWDREWTKLEDMRVLGTAVAIETDKGIRYLDVSKGLTNGNFAEIATYSKTAPLNNGAINSTKPTRTGLLVFEEVVKKSGIANGAEIIGKVTHIVEHGLTKGSKLGDDEVPVDYPKEHAYQILATAAPGQAGGQLLMVFVDAAGKAVTNLPVLRLAPKLGVSKEGSPTLPTERTSTGGQNTFSFSSQAQDADSGNLWGTPRDVGFATGEKNGRLLMPDGAEVPAGAKPYGNAPGGHLYVTDAKEDNKPVKRYYLVYSIVQAGKPIMLSAPTLVFQNPSTDKSPRGVPPSDFKTIGMKGIDRPQGAPAIEVGNLLAGERLEGYKDGPAKGIYAIYDSPAGKHDTNCIGVVLWWGITNLDEVKAAASKAKCPAPF